MVRMQDIAARAGVSQATVSLVLNDRQTGVRIGDATRQRVLEVAQEMGYRPHASAIAMRTGRSGCVALLLSTVDYRSTLPRGLLDGIDDALAERDLHLVVARLPDEKLISEGFVPKILRQWTADGLLIDYTDHIPPRFLEIIAGQQVPAIWLNAQLPGDCVYPDDVEAGARTARHLWKLGHRRIAWVDFSHRDIPGEHYSGRSRREGARQVLRHKKLDFCAALDAHVPQERRMAALSEMLKGANRPTAILTYGPEDAQAAILAAAQGNLQVPRDLSLLTFGPLGRHLGFLTLTTALVPEWQTGAAGVARLLEKIAEPQRALAPLKIEFGWQEGATCAPPPAF